MNRVSLHHRTMHYSAPCSVFRTVVLRTTYSVLLSVRLCTSIRQDLCRAHNSGNRWKLEQEEAEDAEGRLAYKTPRPPLSPARTS
jgi:hypothetical protein